MTHPPETGTSPESQPQHGSIEKALQGNYELQFKPILEEAWAKTKGVKGLLWLSFSVFLLSSVILELVFGFVLGSLMGSNNPDFILELAQEQNSFQFILEFFTLSLALEQIFSAITGGLTAPLLLGWVMISIYRAAHHPYSYHLIFKYFSHYRVLFGAYFLTTLLTYLGLLLFVLPGIYLAICYSFVLPLLMDRQLSIWQAMKISRKAVTRHWFKIFGMTLLVVLILAVSLIPLGIGLIWSLPFTSLVFRHSLSQYLWRARGRDTGI